MLRKCIVQLINWFLEDVIVIYHDDYHDNRMNKKGRYISIRCRLQLQHCVDKFFMPMHDTPGKNDSTFNSCQNDFTTQMKSMINRFDDISTKMAPGLAAMVKPSTWYIYFVYE